MSVQTCSWHANWLKQESILSWRHLNINIGRSRPLHLYSRFKISQFRTHSTRVFIPIPAFTFHNPPINIQPNIPTDTTNLLPTWHPYQWQVLDPPLEIVSLIQTSKVKMLNRIGATRRSNSLIRGCCIDCRRCSLLTSTSTGCRAGPSSTDCPVAADGRAPGNPRYGIYPFEKNNSIRIDQKSFVIVSFKLCNYLVIQVSSWPS